MRLPTHFTQPLSEDYITDGKKLRKFVDRFWKSPRKQTAEGEPYLADWQADLIDRILERYPEDHPKYPGQLRYKQVVISMGRQNGKTEIAAVLGMYGLMMHVQGPTVISLASNTDQANFIYERVRYVIDNSDFLKKKFKTTGTRGIKSRDQAASYVVKPAKAGALQGIPVSMCLFDEVHLCPPEMWSAMVMGGAATPGSIVIGLTTAGDDSSKLLKGLYETGHKAVHGDEDLERFGFFVWEAPEGAAKDDVEALKAANPGIESGIKPLDETLFRARTEPPSETFRYEHNRFQRGTDSSFVEPRDWTALGSRQEPVRRPTIIAVDRTAGSDSASFTAVHKDEDGVIHTRLIASVKTTRVEQMFDMCKKFHRSGVQKFVMDGRQLGDLAAMLKKNGYPVDALSQTQFLNACSTAYSLIKQGKVAHPNDALVNHQMPRAVKKSVGEAWRINRGASKTDIDAVIATVIGIYAAENHAGTPMAVGFF